MRVVLLLLLAMAAPAAGQARDLAPVLVLDATRSPLDLPGHMEVLRDPGGRLTIDDVAFGGAAFTPLPGLVGFGFTADAAWVRMRFHRPPDDRSRWTLELAPPGLERVEVQVATVEAPMTAADFQRLVVGSAQPFAARPIPYSTFLVPLDIPPGGTRVLYVRISSQTSLILRGRVYSEPSLVASMSGLSQWFGLLYGAFTLAFLFNLICFIWLRDWSYLLYAGYVASLLLNHMAMSGTLMEQVPALVEGRADVWLCTTGMLGGCFADLFIVRILRLRRTIPWAAWVLWSAAALRPLSLPLTLMGDYRTGTVLIQLFGIVNVCVLLTAGLWLAWRGDVQARRFMVAFAPAALGAFVTMLRALGFVPSNVFTEQVYFGAALFHVVLMIISMMTRIREAEQAKKDAQVAALAASHEAETRAMRIIEAQTRELVDAKREVELALAVERQAVRDQLQFIDMIAHEYRAPVSVIRTSIDVMEMRTAATGSVPTDLIERMRRSIERLVELIEVGLRRDRIDQPGLSVNPRRLDLGQLAADAVAERIGEGQPVHVHRTGPVPVRADAELLRTAIVNLLENAVKYGPKGGAIDIRIGIERDLAVLRITDRGPGVPEAARGRIFEKYYRAQNVRAAPGVGLGLYLTRKIVTMHGGDLELESAEAGNCTFRLGIPAAPEDEDDETGQEGRWPLAAAMDTNPV